jgi:hypothetical protein
MRRRVAAVVFVVAALVAGSLVVSTPAMALASDCEKGKAGFVDIPDNLSGEVEDVVVPGALIKVELHSGYVGGGQRGWAKVSGATVAGDLVWMDWTTDGGDNWLQCGPFVVGHRNGTKTSAAQRTNSSTDWQFRACGMVVNQPSTLRCTEWW